MTITPIRPRFDRQPTEAELFPFLEHVDVCIYCGRFQNDEQAEERTVAHIQADLLAIHRANEGLIRDFGLEHPGFRDDVYDLLCELDGAEAAEREAKLSIDVTEMEQAR